MQHLSVSVQRGGVFQYRNTQKNVRLQSMVDHELLVVICELDILKLLAYII